MQEKMTHKWGEDPEKKKREPEKSKMRGECSPSPPLTQDRLRPPPQAGNGAAAGVWTAPAGSTTAVAGQRASPAGRFS